MKNYFSQIYYTHANCWSQKVVSNCGSLRTTKNSGGQPEITDNHFYFHNSDTVRHQDIQLTDSQCLQSSVDFNVGKP